MRSPGVDSGDYGGQHSDEYQESGARTARVESFAIAQHFAEAPSECLTAALPRMTAALPLGGTVQVAYMCAPRCHVEIVVLVRLR
ncbi:hypothetical protein Aph01nite_49280 [Acrocarpospora phusangensis]|uniref:Uncharacterized protein n=1 Tax=Acrocarpospora phusangensis TaxID=1070424 RepID=A0A919QDB1_9ACTN|nr:hypothetical protein Aph01nite_49280 [Acrocarpospora phusangensis]